MSIKFKCPHCQKSLSVKDQMAGKKGTCPGCKKVLTVPAATPVPTTNGQQANGTTPKPAPRPVDVEAEAAAILSDKPAEPPPEAAATTIDFNCPMCDEPIQVGLDLAGKNTPCPSCRRIIKVPLPKKPEKVDWKKPNAGLPSLARQNVPVVEGVWDNQESSRVSQEALEEAGALPELREPLTVGQWAQRIMMVGALGAFFVAGIAFVSHRATSERETLSLDHAVLYLKTATAHHELGPEGRAELHRLIGLYHLHANQENSGVEAQKQFDDAFDLLRNSKGTDRDLALAELALARVELGGSGDDVEEGRRLAWKENKNAAIVQKMVGATLAAVRNPDVRLEALRPVLRRVIAAGEPGRVYALANHAFGAASNNAERLYSMEAKSLAGIELLVAGARAEADNVARLLQQEYAQANRPPLASSAVALMMVLGRPELVPLKTAVTDDDNAKAGKAEGYARQGKMKDARDLIDKKTYPALQFSMRLNLAAAALDAANEDRTDLDEAFKLSADLRDTSAAQWRQWRLFHLGLRAGVTEERLAPILESLADAALRARGRLALYQIRLAQSTKAEADDTVQGVPENTLARLLAHEALARHNIRHDKATAQKVLDWPQPLNAFGALGVALGMQN